MKVIAFIFTLAFSFAVIAAIVILWPVIVAEVNYSFEQTSHVQYVVGTEQLDTFQKPLTPPNTDYAIIIPKIAAVAPIIDNVDPKDPYKYIPALKLGVAHLAGSQVPGVKGNVFLFDHNQDYVWDINTYNVKFYLMHRLSAGDEIDIFYQGNQIKYTVYDTRVVDYSQVDFNKVPIPDGKTLTLMTDYPPGTSFQRFIVLAKQVEQ